MFYCQWFLQVELSLIFFVLFGPINRQKFCLHFKFFNPAEQKNLVLSYYSMSVVIIFYIFEFFYFFGNKIQIILERMMLVIRKLLQLFWQLKCVVETRSLLI